MTERALRASRASTPKPAATGKVRPKIDAKPRLASVKPLKAIKAVKSARAVRPAQAAAPASPKLTLATSPAPAKPVASGKRPARRSEAADATHDRKREQILDVAVNLFFKHGYAGTTIADIADKLGVTKPFVYYYFENKEDLFETLSWRASQACLTALHFPSSDKRPAIEKLREGLHRLATENITNFKAGTFYYRETGVLRAPFLRKMRLLGRRFHSDLTNLLLAGQREGDLEFEDAKVTALAIGSVVGFMYAWYKPSGPLSPSAMADRVTGILLKTAGARVTAKPRPKARLATDAGRTRAAA